MIVTDTKVLSQKSKECFFTEMDILQNKAIVEKMTEVYKANNTCVGLAAVQIGEHKRIILVKGLEGNKITIMVNPVIYCRKGGIKSGFESCLSFPDRKGVKVRRHKIIKVKYQGLKGLKFDKEFKGMQARIIQHEIDHLEGKLI